MRYYFAPMEGITGYLYRNAHHRYFKSVDKYFTPFLVPNQNRKFSSKEKNDVLPEHNRDICLVPQILTNNGEDFIWAADQLGQLGYREVNLNLGCPSKTVVTKGKGAGFLTNPVALDRFLYQIFENVDLGISIKTRIGLCSPDDFEELLEIYNKYPVKELIVHPRVQSDYYKNSPNLEAFQIAHAESKNPVCYNGDLFTVNDYREWKKRFLQIDSIMMGRGLVANPGLVDCIQSGNEIERKTLKDFHDELYKGYQETMSGDKNVLFRMKELWFYMISLFADEKQVYKKIKKAEKLKDYETAVDGIFSELELLKDGGYRA